MFDRPEAHSIDILKEINQKYGLVEKGLCSYCGRSPETPLCRNPAMHVLPLMAIKQYDE